MKKEKTNIMNAYSSIELSIYYPILFHFENRSQLNFFLFFLLSYFYVSDIHISAKQGQLAH